MPQGDNAYTKPALSSNVSPFRGTANAPLILLTAIFTPLYGCRPQPRPGPSHAVLVRSLAGSFAEATQMEAQICCKGSRSVRRRHGYRSGVVLLFEMSKLESVCLQLRSKRLPHG